MLRTKSAATIGSPLLYLRPSFSLKVYVAPLSVTSGMAVAISGTTLRSLSRESRPRLMAARTSISSAPDAAWGFSDRGSVAAL